MNKDQKLIAEAYEKILENWDQEAAGEIKQLATNMKPADTATIQKVLSFYLPNVKDNIVSDNVNVVDSPKGHLNIQGDKIVFTSPRAQAIFNQIQQQHNGPINPELSEDGKSVTMYNNAHNVVKLGNILAKD
jgi:hypothetical protein